MPEQQDNNNSPLLDPQNNGIDLSDTAGDPSTGGLAAFDLEKLFQEAEETIDQIVQTKRELKKEKTAPLAASPEVQAEVAEQYNFAIDELERYQQKYNELEFEFQNYKNRMEKQMKMYSSRAKAEVLKDLLEVLDIFNYAKKTINTESFSHSIESYKKGYNLLYKQFMELLTGMGLQKIESMGHEFDPNVHQAVAVEESDKYEKQTIISEIKTGYKYADVLLRPSLVKVGLPPKKV